MSPEGGSRSATLPAPFLQRTRVFTQRVAPRSAPQSSAVKLPTANTMSNIPRRPNLNCTAIAKNTIARVLARQPENGYNNGHTTIVAVHKALLRSTEPCKSPSPVLRQVRSPVRQREYYSRHVTSNNGSVINNKAPTAAIPSQNRTFVRRSSAPDVKRAKQGLPPRKAPTEVQPTGIFFLPQEHYGMLRKSVENAKTLASTMNG